MRKTRSKITSAIGLSAGLLLGTSGCGLEGLFHEGIDGTHARPVTGLRGALPYTIDVLEFRGADENALDALDVDILAGSYAIDLVSGDYTNGHIVGTKGEVRVERYVGVLGKESVTTGLDLDATSTAIALMVQTYLVGTGTPFSAIEGRNIDAAIVRAQASEGPAKTVIDMMKTFLDAANPDGARQIWNPPNFRQEQEPDPENPGGTRPVLVAESSTLNVEWLRRQSFGSTTSTGAFDRALGAAALELKLEGCEDPEQIRVVFEVDFNQGKLDFNCGRITRDKWLRGVTDAGKQMYFVGGVHEDSEIPSDPTLRATINGTMGNRGGWSPNIVPMSDDGTNGDAVANDNVWTVSFVVPRGMRMGYKYTWGQQGDLWTGTEEWPGNQRLMAAVDVNGDGFARRRDNFGDETGNKDKVNSYARGTGSVTWDTDANRDGFLDTRELPLDLDNDCTLDEFVTPTTVAPATVDCETIEQ